MELANIKIHDIIPIRRAIISVSDKTGLAELLQTIDPDKRIEIISSGNTTKAIRELGYEATDVSAYTGFPESPGGLVKTLHPKVHGGFLLNGEVAKHAEYMERQNVPPIDLCVFNLYPFKDTVNPKPPEDGSKPKKFTFEDAKEKIDIGGPAALRSAAKGFLTTAVLVNWQDAKHIHVKDGEAFTTLEDRATLMRRAFEHTAAYDAAIVDYLAGQYPDKIAEFYKS